MMLFYIRIPQPDQTSGRRCDRLAKCRFIAAENIRFSGGNLFGLVDGDVCHRKTFDHLPIAGDEAGRPGFIIVSTRRNGLSFLKNPGKHLAVWDAKQKLRHRRGIVQMSGCK